MSRLPSRPSRAVVPLLVIALATVGCSYSSRSALPPTPISVESSTLYAADGTPVYTFHAEENRRVVRLEDVPLHVQNSVIAIEDERFYRHNGVDLRAIIRAVRENSESGGISQGGSTITQQYVKKVLLRDESRTVERKLEEASTALQLERHYSKERILELYLNAIYFGNGAYGIATAAQQYFGKDPKDLTLAEGALLAGLIQRPTATDPYDAPELAVARRNVVLEKVRENLFASDAEVDAALAEPLTLSDPTVPAAERYQAAYFVEEVKQFILDDPRFGATPQERRDLLFGGGLRIQTTVDLAAQAAAEAAANSVLPDAGHDPDVALVSIEPDTGYVRAMVGGRDFFGTGTAAKVNLATTGPGRPAGSSFKPFVLAAALAEGIPASRTYAAPGCYTVPNVKPTYRPCNYSDSESVASANLVEGTVHSYNTLFVQLMMDVGPKDAVEAAASYGIRSPLLAIPSAVLGTNEVTPAEMASAYGTFANRGVHVPPVLVTRITRADGTILFRQAHKQDRVLDADIADTVTAILTQVIARGTGRAAAIDPPSAGKTGTGQNHRDAWFVGYTPELVTSVWVGFQEGQIDMEPPRTPIRVVGGSYPARIWHAYMAVAMAGRPATPFHPPPADAFTGAVPPTDLPPLEDPFAVPFDDYEEQFGEAPPTGGTVVTPGRGFPTSTTTTLRPRGTTTTTPSSPRIVAVPAVVGKSAGEATSILRNAGFVVARKAASGNYAPGTVVSQSPPGGSLATEGSTVTIGVVGG